MSTYSIISTTVFGTPSGNYDGSSQDWASDAVKAAAYYQGRGSVQTVNTRVTDCIGEIIIEATLDLDSDSATWFETLRLGDDSSETDLNRSDTITGNFTWLRARVVGFDSGTINYVTVTY